MSAERRATRGELQTHALRGAKWTLVHTGFSILLGFGVNILLARVLGVSDFGRLAYLTLVITVAGQIAELGLAGAVIQFGAKAHAVGDRDKAADILSKSLGFRLLTFAPAVTIVVLALVRLDPLILGLAIVIGIWVKSLLAGATLALSLENKTHRVAQNAILVNFLTQAAVVVAVIVVGEADAVWAARIVLSTLGVALAMPYIHRAYRRAAVRPKLPRKFPPGFWRYALPAGAATIIGNLLVSRTEVLFLTWWDMPVAAGLFAAAYGLAGHVFSPAQALVGPLIPAISGLREVDAAAVGAALRRTLRASSTAVALLMAVVLAPIALLIPLIYGSEYAEAGPAFIALGLGAGVATVGGPISAFIQARLQGRRILLINLISLTLNLGLVLALLPLLGLWGAVLANIGGTLVRVGALLVGELRDAELSLRTGLHDGAPLAVSAVASLVALQVGASAPSGVMASAAVAGVVGVVLSGLGVWLTRSGLTSDDVRVIGAAAPQHLRGPFTATLRAISHRA